MVAATSLAAEVFAGGDVSPKALGKPMALGATDLAVWLRSAPEEAPMPLCSDYHLSTIEDGRRPHPVRVRN